MGTLATQMWPSLGFVEDKTWWPKAALAAWLTEDSSGEAEPVQSVTLLTLFRSVFLTMAL